MFLHPHSYAALAGVVLLIAATAGPHLPSLLHAMPHPMPQGAGTQGGALFAELKVKDNKIDDTQPTTNLDVCLLNDPGAVKPAVFLEADGVRFEKCRVDFDNTNFKQPQIIKMYPKAEFKEGTSTSIIGARLAWQGNENHGKTQSLTITRQVKAGRVCQANGDPHYLSFDGRAFDFMGMACYYLFRSPSLVVQSRHASWHWGNPAAAINVGAAVIYGKTAWLVDCGQADVNKRVQQLSPDTKGVTVIKNEPCSDIQFQMGDGSQVKMQIDGGGSNKCYINIQVVVPPIYVDKTSGLCGKYNDKQEDDWTKRDNSMANDPTDFGNSWALQPDEDVFVKGYTASIINEMQAQPETQECKFPADLSGFGVAPPPPAYTPVAVAPNPQPQITPIPPAVAAAAPKNRDDQPFIDFVTDLCKRALTVPGFDKLEGVPKPDQHIADCVKDARLGGTIEMVDSYRVAFQRLLHTHLSAAMDRFKICERTGKPRPRSDKEINDEANRLGLGNLKCPTAAIPSDDDYGAPPAPTECASKGTCQTFGCECAQGFTKFDCTLDLSKEKIPPAPAAAAVAPAGVAAAPAQPAQPAPVAQPPAGDDYGDYRRR